MTLSDQKMAAYAGVRKAKSKSHAFSYKPELYMMVAVYYLRGIRYIFSDTRAYAAELEAAANAKIPAALQPPTVPNISMNVVTAPQGTTKPDAVTAQMLALQTQMDALRSAVMSNSNIQVAATYAHATARGIEFVDLFQRPLAFGYVPLAEAFEITRGLSDFCLEALGTPRPPNSISHTPQPGG